MSRRRKQLAPGMAVVPKQTRASSTWLWVGMCVRAGTLGRDTTEVSIGIEGTEPIVGLLTQYHFDGSGRFDFFHGHVFVDSLEPATGYAVTVVSKDRRGVQELDATCRFRTLPTEIGEQPLRLLAASCFDIGTDADRQIPGLCDELFREEFPDMTLLLGDQVYLDAPWWEFRARTRRDPREHYLTKYWSAWGRDADEGGGLSPLLAVGGNWFVPDDHEFWNNFPHATPLALHSFRNWRHILRARAERTVAWVRGGEIPESLVAPPSTTEWDTWSRAAFELYGSFQTPAPDGAVSAGKEDDQRTAPPRTAVVQHVDIGDVRIILLDTRTQRSRSAKAPRSAFVPRADLEQFLDLATGPELTIVGLAQPVFVPPTLYDGVVDKLKAFLDFDRGIENYREMYPEFWSGLVEARQGKPTVFVGGDVHYNDVAVASSVAMAQVVSSPMSLVTGLADVTKVRERLSGRERRRSDLSVASLIPGTPGEIEWLVDYKDNRLEGMSTLDLTRTGGVYRLRVEHHPRDRTTAGMVVELEIDPSAPIEQRIQAARLQ